MIWRGTRGLDDVRRRTVQISDTALERTHIHYYGCGSYGLVFEVDVELVLGTLESVSSTSMTARGEAWLRTSAAVKLGSPSTTATPVCSTARGRRP
jgi:hypothetical protein